MRFLDTILEIVFPAKCIVCAKSGSDLCLSCLREAPEAGRESAPWIFPLYDYRHPAVKKSLWFLKYKGKRRLANVFAESMYEKILEELSELSVLENFREPVLIPIPLSGKRYRERGFNQAELLCRELIKIHNVRTPAHTDSMIMLKLRSDILIKKGETIHQARIKDRSARLKNITGSFTVQKTSLIQNQNIILIDDVLTTGATLGEARKVLKCAGARKVIAFTVAH
jgi:ComF family protein